jgi:hypothetical protein
MSLIRNNIHRTEIRNHQEIVYEDEAKCYNKNDRKDAGRDRIGKRKRNEFAF